MKKLLFFGALVFLLGGCVKNEPAPVWLEINEWSIVDNPLVEPGYLSHNFTDAWVYVDNKLIGVFELPCKIPVMMEGSNKSVRVYPTIRNNGISATKKIYPFCEPYEVYQDLVSGGTITINPVTKYYSNCQFWLEDFSTSNAEFATDEDVSNAEMYIEEDPNIVLDGKYGHVHFEGADSLWVGVSSMPLQLPQGGAEVYLEIEYRNSMPILQGVIAELTSGNEADNPYISMNAQGANDLEWKKIYIDLREIVSYYTNATGFKQYLKSAINSTYPSGDIYIDNIRLVYF
jgi:hypothetical protein